MPDIFAFKNANGEATQREYTFSMGVPVDTNKPGADGNRRFGGVAYTGNPITGHYYWGTVVFDMSLISVPAKMSILRDHEPSQIVGYSDESAVTQDGLVLGGVLSKVTDAGKEVTALSDEGFPWQMSVRIQPSRIEELTAGNTAIVNGRTVTGPAYIFRESTLVETSFTPTGWDADTSATALSRNTNPTSQEDAKMSKELEDKVAQLEGELGSLKTKNEALMSRNTELEGILEKQVNDAKVAKVREAYARIGQELTDDDVKKFSAMPAEAVDAVVEALSFAQPKDGEVKEQAKNKLPDNAFSHQASGPVKTETGDALVNAINARVEASAQAFSKNPNRR